jgi:hypothetical protein
MLCMAAKQNTINHMFQIIGAAILFGAALLPTTSFPQSREAPQPQKQQPATPATPAKPAGPMTVRQVIESLSSLRNSARVESLISKRGVQFQATPEIADILKQFGASTKLISMIPTPAAPPPPPPPPAPKLAGPLTIMCEPKDCAVVVDDKYEGSTEQNRKTLNGLHAGSVTVQIFADGYEHLSRQIALEERKPAEEKFTLKAVAAAREESARATLLNTITKLGGVDGLVELSDIEGTGGLKWANNSGTIEEWNVNFNKRPGRDLVTRFKTADGQCTALIQAKTTKQDCKGGLKNGGDKIAADANSLLLSYQLQDVLHALLQRPLIASESDSNRLESRGSKDSYVLTVGKDNLPSELLYQIGNGDPIHIEYSDYMTVGDGLYPGRIALGRLNSPPVWVFKFDTIRSRVTRSE